MDQMTSNLVSTAKTSLNIYIYMEWKLGNTIENLKVTAFFNKKRVSPNFIFNIIRCNCDTPMMHSTWRSTLWQLNGKIDGVFF